jgi:pre-rRNA-processing protein TSR1
VKSKDLLTFRCGWRTWTGRPVFSQNNLNSDKHKYERFLPQTGTFFAASVFGPVTYTPSPVLVFRELNGKKELVATGSMLGADADRIVVKRVILTGYPVRVHKRHATVKYMFLDPEDVMWFQPAGLTTKHGLNGRIEASVGEHGTMKCLFNAPIKQHDTVCLPLYKRIYPKFEEDNTAGDEERTVRSIRKRQVLVVK